MRAFACINEGEARAEDRQWGFRAGLPAAGGEPDKGNAGFGRSTKTIAPGVTGEEIWETHTPP